LTNIKSTFVVEEEELSVCVYNYNWQ